MYTLLLLLTLSSLSIAGHAGANEFDADRSAARKPARVGRYLASALAGIDDCVPSPRIKEARPRQSDHVAKTAEIAARRFTTQLIRVEHFADVYPGLAHDAFGKALDQLVSVYGLRYSDTDERRHLDETDLLLAFTEENIDRFWQTVGILWRDDPKASDPGVWLGRLVAGAGGPSLTQACEYRLRINHRY